MAEQRKMFRHDFVAVFHQSSTVYHLSKLFTGKQSMIDAERQGECRNDSIDLSEKQNRHFKRCRLFKLFG
jgi:hypothetical protein